MIERILFRLGYAKAKLPSLHYVMSIVTPDGVGKEIPLIVRKVYQTIKDVGNFEVDETK